MFLASKAISLFWQLGTESKNSFVLTLTQLSAVHSSLPTLSLYIHKEIVERMIKNEDKWLQVSAPSSLHTQSYVYRYELEVEWVLTDVENSTSLLFVASVFVDYLTWDVMQFFDLFFFSVLEGKTAEPFTLSIIDSFSISANKIFYLSSHSSLTMLTQSTYLRNQQHRERTS